MLSRAWPTLICTKTTSATRPPARPEDHYWHFFDVVKAGDHWKLPKPFEIGALFATVPEALTDQRVRRTGSHQAGRRPVGNAISNAISYDWLPVGVRPFYDLATNKQAYSGSPILTQVTSRSCLSLRMHRTWRRPTASSPRTRRRASCLDAVPEAAPVRRPWVHRNPG